MYDDNRVCIMGMGYVGLTLAVAMAENGFNVDGIEINPKILKTIQGGHAHFYEANLDYMIRRNLAKGRLRFSETIPEDEAFDVYVVTVGTPLDENQKPRMDLVERVAKQVGEHMAGGSLVVLRSTVRLGATLNVAKPILDATGKDFDLAFCPERTTEGRALAELPVLPQVVGGMNRRSQDRAVGVFRRITPTILQVSDIQTAELIKLLDNSFRDLFFGFGNEVAMLCEAIGADATEVIKTANLGYERTNIAWPGFVGGPCLEKDPHILIESLQHTGFVPKMIQTARQLNEDLVGHVFDRTMAMIEDRDDLTISIMGMAFKGRPDTDDLRGSPSLWMIDHIRKELPGATIRAQDYIVKDEAIRELGVEPVDDREAFNGSDVVFILNNNPRYETLDVETRAEAMKRPGVIYDAWNVVFPNIDLPEGVILSALGS